MKQLALPLIIASLLVFGCILLVIQQQQSSSSSVRHAQKASPSASPRTIAPLGGVASEAPVYRQPVISPPISDTPVSPYEIAAFVNQYKYGDLLLLESYWQRMNISVEDFKECSGCKAVLFKAEMGGQAGREIILRLHSYSIGFAVFLIFKRADHLWKFLGQTRTYEARFYPPEPRFIKAYDKYWMIVSYEAGHGSGYGLTYDDWFEFRNSRLQEVLRHPTSKYTMAYGDSPEIDVDSKTAIIKQRNRVTTITIPFITTYRKYDGRHDKVVAVWRRKRKAVFVRTLPAIRFSLDRQHSDFSDFEADELDEAYIK